MRKLTLLLIILALSAPPVLAQSPDGDDNSGLDKPPFSLPFDGMPGPNSWLYEQHYGNTTSAFNYGNVWYLTGQGLHFGVDFEAACGTPVLAIADGVVAYVDASGFGAGPHNLVLDHPGTGYASLYGHLLETPQFVRGDRVARGQQIGLSGDPDGSCESRPHLHLEIRSKDYQTAYDPLPFFDVNWHMLASFGPFTNRFQQDLDTPRRWVRIEDQPDIKFSTDTLNNYQNPWPPAIEFRAPISPPAARTLAPLPDAVQVTQAPVVRNTWNVGWWWRPGDAENVYVIDMVPGQDTGVFRQPVDGSEREYVEAAPPTLVSPNGDVTVRNIGGGSFRITRRSSGEAWDVYTGGNYPTVSPDGSRLLWEVVYGEMMPGQVPPGIEVWVSNLDGSLRRMVHTQSGGWSMWLDARRLLIVKPVPYAADAALYILDIDDPAVTPQLLGSYRFLRGIRVSPGGGHIAFWLPFQEDPAASGVYVQPTQIGAQPAKLDFFGAYRWRDDRSLYTLSYDFPGDVHTLGVIDIQGGTHRTLTAPAELPICVANGEWDVSPDGRTIVYLDPTDYGLYRLDIAPAAGE